MTDTHTPATDTRRDNVTMAIEVLRPFANIADQYAEQEDDHFQVLTDMDVLAPKLLLAHFRSARKALATLTRDPLPAEGGHEAEGREIARQCLEAAAWCNGSQITKPYSDIAYVDVWKAAAKWISETIARPAPNARDAALEEMPPTKDRQQVHEAGYVESDLDWAASNEEALTWFADNHAAIRRALKSPAPPVSADNRTCTCHPDDNPPVPCPRKFALSECRAADEAVSDGCHGLDTPERICFYEQDFYVLSNFSAFRVVWRGRGFDTSEAAYHWERFATGQAVDRSPFFGAQAANLADGIQFAKSAHEAFKLAQENKAYQRPDWDEVKIGVMREIIRAKANQHEYVRRKLLATGDRELVENSWRDDFWGWGPNRDGKNMLGKLWMEIRAELTAAIKARGT